MNWFNNLSISKKIASGFTAMALLMVISVLLVLKGVQDLQDINERVFELRVPTVLASTNMVNGVNHSLAGLRGWMILHKEQFKHDRAEAWKEMDEAYAKLQHFSKNWTNPENIKRLQEVGGILDEFRQAQQEIEDISGTVDDNPANKILLEEAAPRAAIIIKEITDMINIEADQPATEERKALLGMMADVRGSMGMSLANIRAFLLTGDEKFSNEFQRFWDTNEMRYADLKRNRSLLTSRQSAAFARMDEAREEFKVLPPKMFDIRGGDQWNIANYWLGTKAAPKAKKILEIMEAMVANQEQLEAEDIALAKSTATMLDIEIVVIGAVSVLLAIIVAVFVTRMIVVPVAKAAEGLKLIAAGKLGRRWDVTSKDELGRMLEDMNRMSDNLTEVIAEVMNGAMTIDVAAKQVSSGTMDLSQRTEEQASSLEETASSMEEMTSTVKQNADNANQANQLAQVARDQADAGGRVVNNAVKAMGEINQSSNKIADIIGVVEEIAFQTNLLALNAAVEAARAGESGRGFAVVASEVRVLAGRSADAAKEIKALIEDSLSKVKAGTELVDKSGETLEEILTGVKKVSDIVYEIAAASNEQSSGIDQVNKAVMQMDEMTQMNASLVEEAASASRSMEDQAKHLSERVRFFDLGDQQHRIARTIEQNVRKQQQQAEVAMQTKSKKIASATKSVPAIANRSDDSEWQDF
ncbi:MAG: methyl-accepting chemotaxis protein [Gammaproteobacteria bacterium]|nr:methyl-accepting chemotaxis protein [Gammaproteobacteria bacterium]